MKCKTAGKKYHIDILLYCICIFLFSACGKMQSEQIEFKDYQVVQIGCENQKGSGVVYAASEKDVVVITAAHVLDGAETAEIVWKTDWVETDTIIRVAGLDLAFLKTNGGIARQVLSQDPEKSSENQVILRGYDGAGEMQETIGTVSESWIYVEDFEAHMMIVKADTVPGMSGGGVFYKDGRFAGIICGRDEAGNTAILPASVISAEYDAIFGK